MNGQYSARVVGMVVLAIFLIVGGDAVVTVLAGTGPSQTFVILTRFV